MRTYTIQVQRYDWSNPITWTVAAPSFLEAWKKAKRLMNRQRYTILSIVQTAVLNA